MSPILLTLLEMRAAWRTVGGAGPCSTIDRLALRARALCGKLKSDWGPDDEILLIRPASVPTWVRYVICVIYGTVRTEEMVCLHGRPAQPATWEARVVFSGRVRGHRHLLVQQRERIVLLFGAGGLPVLELE